MLHSLSFWAYGIFVFFTVALDLFELWKGEALAEHVSWSRVSRVTLISMEFSSPDHS